MDIIGLSGYAQVGKDVATEVLVERLGFRQRTVTTTLTDVLCLINPIVDWDADGAIRFRTVIEDYGYDEAKAMFPEVRTLLQTLGFDARDVLGETIWIDRILAAAATDGRPTVVSSVRDPVEAELITAEGGRVIRINRPGYGPVNDHPSETAMDHWDYDAVIENDGSIGDLTAKVVTVVHEFGMA